VELRDYLRVLFKHWIAIILITVTVMAIVVNWAFVQLLKHTPG